MVRDENDRPYEDGQGRPVNPDLTGDVLSPRWSTDDTDEQPAIQVSPSGETYILPPEPGRDVLDDLPPASPDVLSPAGQGQSGEPAYLPLDRAYDGPSDDDRPAGPDAQEGGSYDESSYANGSYEEGSYDKGSYEEGRYDEGSYDAGSRDSGSHDNASYDNASYDGGSYGNGSYDAGFDDERPRRGFLGSGWTDDSDDAARSDRSEREGREGRGRTRMLVLAAAAVVLVGVGAGFALTGGSDDPCADGRCASAGQVSTPVDSAADDEAEEETAEPAEEETADPATTADPSPTAAPTRTTREPAARPTATRSEEQATRPSARPSRSQEPETRDTGDQNGTVRDSQTEQTAKNEQSAKNEQTAKNEQPTQTAEKPAEESVTQEPEPAPTKEERKGLFDYLFPWA